MKLDTIYFSYQSLIPTQGRNTLTIVDLKIISDDSGIHFHRILLYAARTFEVESTTLLTAATATPPPSPPLPNEIPPSDRKMRGDKEEKWYTSITIMREADGVRK